MSSPPVPPEVILGSVTGRVVGRRRVSKRLAFYDLRELVDADVDARALRACSSSAAASAGDTAASSLPVVVELVAKAGTAGFPDEAALAAAQKDALKLGNIVRVTGAWVVAPDGECTVECRAVRAVERWADAHPGVHFTRPADVEPSARARAPDHDAKPAPCKFWLNQGTCHKGDACRYAHDPDRAGHLDWIAERKRQRRLLSLAEGDPHGVEGVASKAHRAAKFAEWLVATFGEETLRRGSGVLDVAGGRGDVSFELHTARGVPCTLVEPRPRKLNRLQHKWLKKRRQRERKAEEWNRASGDGDGDWDGGSRDDVPASAPSRERTGTDEAFLESAGVLCAQIRAEFTPDNWHAFADCSVVVGMHPDQATEAIVDFAAKFGKPFAVVPCCVFPQLFPHRTVPAGGDRDGDGDGDDTPVDGVGDGKVTPVTERRQLVRYLARKTKGDVAFLDFEGANQVVYSVAPPPPL